MYTRKLQMALLSVAVIGAFTFTSCKKDKEQTPATPATVDNDQSGAAANNTAETISDDIISIGSEACDKTGSGNSGAYRTESSNYVSAFGCATFTVDTTNKIVTVGFNGGTCLDGKTRTGTLVYNYSASANGAKHYRDPGFTVSVSTNNYAVDGNTVVINSKTITNTTPAGFNPMSTNETWSITASLTINLANSGGTITWNCNRVKTLLNTATVYTNASTPINWLQARIGLNGSASGTRSNGETFTVNITNQLIRDFGGCSIGGGRHPFIQGSFVYTPQNKPARTFDYGSGTCDLNATVTINGNTYPFIL